MFHGTAEGRPGLTIDRYGGLVLVQSFREPLTSTDLAEIERAARGPENLMIPLKAALADYVTIGECCAVLRGVFGEYQPGEAA